MEKITLHITPQTFVKYLPNQVILFRIPEVCYRQHQLYYFISKYLLHGKEIKQWVLDELAGIQEFVLANGHPESSQGCIEYIKTGTCKHILSESGKKTRARITRYFQYKRDIKRLCDEQGFNLQVYGWSIYFFFPMPVRWSKKKKALMRGQWKVTKPDFDNLLKGMCDSLGKRRRNEDDPSRLPDEIVAGLAGIGKYWTDKPEGYIEIFQNQPCYNPYNVKFIDQLKIEEKCQRSRPMMSISG